jgi:hypothetical protein
VGLNDAVMAAAGWVPGAVLPAAELLVGWLSTGPGELLLKQLHVLLQVGAVCVEVYAWLCHVGCLVLTTGASWVVVCTLVFL